MESIPEVSPAPATVPVRLPWYLRPYVQLCVSILFSAASQPFMKKGEDRVHELMTQAGAPEWQGPFYSLGNGWIWLAIAAMIASLFGWMYALKSVQISIAFNLAGIIHVLVPLSSWIFLGETISFERWAGITLVFLGVLVIAREAARQEGAPV